MNLIIKSLVLLFLVFQPLYSYMYNPSLQGKWYCVSNFTDIVYSFYEDDTFNLEIGEILTFTGTYSIEKNKDRIIFYLNGERISFSFLLFENDLFLVRL